MRLTSLHSIHVHKTDFLCAEDTRVSKEFLAYLHYLAMEYINGVSGPGIKASRGVSRVSGL